MHKNLIKIKSNDTQFEVIENTILDLLAIHFLDWWRHWIFSLIRETFVKQTFLKNSEMFFIFHQNFFWITSTISLIDLFRKVFDYMMLHTSEIFKCFHFLKFLLLMRISSDVIISKNELLIEWAWHFQMNSNLCQ